MACKDSFGIASYNLTRINRNHVTTKNYVFWIPVSRFHEDRFYGNEAVGLSHSQLDWESRVKFIPYLAYYFIRDYSVLKGE